MHRKAEAAQRRARAPERFYNNRALRPRKGGCPGKRTYHKQKRPMSSRPELRNVEVRVRVRPGSKKSCVRTHSTKELSVDDKRWAFDRVYGPKSSQEDVYEEAVKPLVEATLDGYNSTVFAYGQTGSGKTYTMGTGTETLSRNEGVARRCV